MVIRKTGYIELLLTNAIIKTKEFNFVTNNSSTHTCTVSIGTVGSIEEFFGEKDDVYLSNINATNWSCKNAYNTTLYYELVNKFSNFKSPSKIGWANLVRS